MSPPFGKVMPAARQSSEAFDKLVDMGQYRKNIVDEEFKKYHEFRRNTGNEKKYNITINTLLGDININISIPIEYSLLFSVYDNKAVVYVSYKLYFLCRSTMI